METAVQIKNSQGVALHGILHTPDDGVARGAPGVLWLSAGQKVRQGAWRMNVAIARRLARRGIPTLRFDYQGIGDSEGDHRHGEYVMDFYGFIQTGGFRDDVTQAARFLMSETGVSSLVMGGLCGGGLSGLFAGPSLGSKVYGHLLVDLPVTISSAARQKILESDAVELLRARPGEADTVILLYLRKVLSFEAWRRLVTGESDVRLMVAAGRTKLQHESQRLLKHLPESMRPRVEETLGRWLHRPTMPPPAPPALKAEPVAPKNAIDERAAATGEVRNEAAVRAFRAALDAGQRVSFLNSSTYHPTFMNFFGDDELKGETSVLRARGIDLRIAEDTNHIFSLEHSRQCLFDAIDALVTEAQGSQRERPSVFTALREAVR